MDSGAHNSTGHKNGDSAAKKPRDFRLHIALHLAEGVRKSYTVKGVNRDTTIKALRGKVELVTGVPYSLQRLHYIDDGELREDLHLSSYDVVPGGQMKLKLWPMWESLISAVIAGNTERVFSLGVSMGSGYEPPRIAYMNRPSERQKCYSERCSVALFVAACCGHQDLCAKLIKSGADVNWKSSTSKRSALHAAAAMGQTNVVGLLLEKGANIKAMDMDGQTAITLAHQFGHKACERSLVQFTWRQRAASSKHSATQEDSTLLPHQRFDSALQASLVDGPEAQVYRPQLVPPGEFGGTGFDAPRRKVKTPGVVKGGLHAESRGNSAPSNAASQPLVYYDYQSPSDWLLMTSDVPDVVALTADSSKDASTTAPSAGQLQQQQQQQQQHFDNQRLKQKQQQLQPTSPQQHQPKDHHHQQHLHQQQQPLLRRHLADQNDDLIMTVINRKMLEQQEKGLGGLPYDLWLEIADRPELFQALKDRGQLDSVLQD